MLSRVNQNIAQSPLHDQDATFALGVWVGTIGGSALSTDPSPNTTPPAANRILRISPRKGMTVLQGSGRLQVICGVVAASSITLQLWIFDSTQNTWIQYGAPFTITPTGAASNVAAVTHGNLSGAQLFLQVTANTLVQAFGYEYF